MTDDEEKHSSEDQTVAPPTGKAEVTEHGTLKYHLLGPSLTKAGQDSVDQQKVIIIYSTRYRADQNLRSLKLYTMHRKAQSSLIMKNIKTRT